MMNEFSVQDIREMMDLKFISLPTPIYNEMMGIKDYFPKILIKSDDNDSEKITEMYKEILTLTSQQK